MAKSKIIKDLANSNVDTMTALKRAKVLFSELGNQDLLNWVNYEISGYPADVPLPDYRIERGHLKGSFVRGTMRAHVKATDISLPLGSMPQDLKDDILNVSFRESIGGLKQLSDGNTTGQLVKTIPAECFHMIAKYNNDPFMNIISARVIVGVQCIADILATIENRLLDALLLLEREFGNLDDLDIDATQKSPEEIENIVNQVYIIVYNDSSISIGDGNKIKDSSISTSNE